jgi:hypothetical protein
MTHRLAEIILPNLKTLFGLQGHLYNHIIYPFIQLRYAGHAFITSMARSSGLVNLKPPFFTLSDGGAVACYDMLPAWCV